MTPVPVARKPHHLPGLAVDRQCDGARDAAFGVGPDGACLHRRGRRLAAEQFLRSHFGIIGMGERRQWLGIDAALVLRACCVAREEYDGEQRKDGALCEVAPTYWR